MTTLGLLTDAELDRFERFVALAAERTRGPGVTLGQVGDADGLARELSREDPDPERVEVLSVRLGLEPEDLEVLENED